MLAQEVEGVPAAGAGLVDAGDGEFYGYSAEEQNSNPPVTVDEAAGEDEEISVMRVLWDLTDPANEHNDRVALGFEKVFEIIDNANVVTLHDLWAILESGSGDDHGRTIDYGAIFESHNVSPLLRQNNAVPGRSTPSMTIGGAPGNVWNAAGPDPIPVFRWEIPVGWPGGAPQPGAPFFPAEGNILHQFGIKVFNEDFELIFDSGMLEEGPDQGQMSLSPADPVTRRQTVSWQPTDADWRDGGPGHEAISKYGGRKYWVVYGKWDRLWDGDTKPYWSDAEWFEIVK